MNHTEMTSPSMSESRPGEDEKKRTSQKFWANYFTFYDALNMSAPYRRMIERQIELLNPASQDLILDAGTGTGNVAAELLNRGSRVVGIDFSEEGLEICRRKLPQGDFRFGDMSQPLDFAPDYFDKIICSLVLYTFENKVQELILSEFFRVVRPGGRVVITSLATGFSGLKVYTETVREIYRGSSLGNTLLLCFRYSINSMRFVYTAAKIRSRHKIGEYNFTDRERLASMLEEAGFRVEAVEPTFASQGVTMLARKPS